MDFLTTVRVRDQVLSERTNLQRSLQEQRSTISSLTDQLARYKAIEQRLFDEKQSYQSKLEAIMEEKSKLAKVHVHVHDNKSVYMYMYANTRPIQIFLHDMTESVSHYHRNSIAHELYVPYAEIMQAVSIAVLFLCVVCCTCTFPIPCSSCRSVKTWPGKTQPFLDTRISARRSIITPAPRLRIASSRRWAPIRHTL